MLALSSLDTSTRSHAKSITDALLIRTESVLETSEISIRDADDMNLGAPSPSLFSKKSATDAISDTAVAKNYLEPINFNLLKNKDDQLPLLTRAFALNRLNNGENYKNLKKNGQRLMPKINFQKSNLLTNQLFYEDSEDDQSSRYNNDWSKQSCSTFLTPIEMFLKNQRQREKSSRRRCNEILKVRAREYSQNECEIKLKEYDEKINLKLLMKKKSKENSGLTAVPTGGSLGNYRAIIAQETIRKGQICDRCSLRNRKQEEQFLKNCLECALIKEVQKPKFPRILPKLKLYDTSDDISAPFSSKRKSIGAFSSSSNNDSKSPNGSLKTINEYGFKQITPQRSPRKNSNN